MAKVNNSKRVKTDKGFFRSLSEKCSSFAGLLVFAMLALNLSVVYFFEKSRRPQVVYSVERVFVNTNVSSTVGVPLAGDPAAVFVNSATNFPASSDQKLPDEVRLTTPYDFFTYDLRRFCRMFDRMFAEGSLTSYGRIVVIFPDRILLEDGSYINNSKWRSSQPSPVVAAATVK